MWYHGVHTNTGIAVKDVIAGGGPALNFLPVSPCGIFATVLWSDCAPWLQLSVAVVTASCWWLWL